MYVLNLKFNKDDHNDYIYSIKCGESSKIPYRLKNIKKINVLYFITKNISSPILYLKLFNSNNFNLLSNYLTNDVFIFTQNNRSDDYIVWKTYYSLEFKSYINLYDICIKITDILENEINIDFHIGLSIDYDNIIYQYD